MGISQVVIPSIFTGNRQGVPRPRTSSVMVRPEMHNTPPCIVWHVFMYSCAFLLITRPSVALSLPCANIVCGAYRYTADIHAFTSGATPQNTYPWTRYHTPIDLDRIRPFLYSHPDQRFARPWALPRFPGGLQPLRTSATTLLQQLFVLTGNPYSCYLAPGQSHFDVLQCARYTIILLR
jgi:hypothetical protein